MNSLTPVALEYHQDALSVIASRVITEQQQNLPRLNDVLIVIPDYQARHRLMRLLASEAEKRGFSAILPPQITTLSDYVEKNITLGTAVLPAEQRSLVLMEALQQHKHLFNHANLWTAGDALLKLFDQLTLYQSTLPESLDDFIQQLEHAYGCTSDEIHHLGHEARLIHTLWQAWHHQLEANDNVDNNAAYLIKLARAMTHATPIKALYIVHHQDFLPAENQWLDHARQTYSGCEFFYSYEQDIVPGTPEKPPLSEFLNRVLEHNDVDLRQRAIAFRLQQEESPAKNHIRYYKAPGFEEEAKAISIQIRQWRLQNIKRVGLVIEDRQLARRIRALLDRANIALRDAGGWALSTTSAAALLESWLVAIEEDFAYKPLLTVIKSPFFLISNERLEAVHHFEYDIIRHENITRDLSRYRNAISSRLRRQNSPTSNTSEALYALINDIETAAQPLNALLKRDRFSIGEGLRALSESITQIGLLDYFQNEAAGQEILQLIQHLTQIATQSNLTMNWEDLRTWVSRNLEQRNFKPIDEYEEYVDLLHLPQTALAHYEGVIIGGLTSEHFPGSSDATPFFNSQVKAELGLPVWQEEKAKRLNDFRRLLESAPTILLTINEGSGKQSSPWLELLNAFHQLAYGDDLSHENMQRLVEDSRNDILKEHGDETEIPSRPAPVISKEHLPHRYSASSHQKLIDCPYAFYAASILGLQAPEEVQETMAKNEYGSRVHLCVQAFHQNIPTFPGPFEEKITDENKHLAIKLMHDIAKRVFSLDLEQNFQHRGWLKRWQNLIPKYIDWQQKRDQQWSFHEAELRTSKELNNQIEVMGRIDRLDKKIGAEQQLAVIDYKTGYSPRQDDTLSGESVQLAHYVLSLPQKVDEALYLQMDQDKITQTTLLQEDELQDTIEKAQNRLDEINQLMEEGKGLPAWGDKTVCQYCQMKGLCRFEQWNANQ